MRFFIILSAWLLLLSSCDKLPPLQLPNRQPRTVQFVLYTNEDFSNDYHNITFQLTIRNGNGRTIWDSLLAPMKVKDIPGVAHKIVVDKIVPNDDKSELRAGFIYTIEHVGISWYFDNVSKNQKFKKVEFGFR